MDISVKLATRHKTEVAREDPEFGLIKVGRLAVNKHGIPIGIIGLTNRGDLCIFNKISGNLHTVRLADIWREYEKSDEARREFEQIAGAHY